MTQVTEPVEENPLPDVEMYKEASKWGFSDPTARVLGHLYAYMLGDDIPPDELARWKQLNVVDAQGRIMLEHDGVDVVEWTLMGMTWDGYVERAKVVVQDEGVKSS